MKHTYMTSGMHLFGGKRSRHGDRPSPRGRFLIRMAKQMAKSGYGGKKGNMI